MSAAADEQEITNLKKEADFRAESMNRFNTWITSEKKNLESKDEVVKAEAVAVTKFLTEQYNIEKKNSENALNEYKERRAERDQ
jgi:hypothetical protein